MDKKRNGLYRKPSRLHYALAKAVSWLAAKVVFRRKMLRNEIKNADGPFVVIANHEAALDFVNLIGATKRPMSFVLSWSFYSTLPIRGFLDRMGVIPKQQFQSGIADMKKMKAVIDSGEPLVIYPAGLMCEDGLSTPIPQATYKFLKWLGADVYAARCAGTYFVMPKWAKGLRPGRTYLDIYKLFSAEELASMSVDEVKAKTDEALLYDAYREQESLLSPYYGAGNIEGLENVLYMCPHCGREFTMAVRDGDTIYCGACGYAQQSDSYGFLHKISSVGEEIRYVSDWSKLIQSELARRCGEGEDRISAAARIHMVDPQKHRFTEVGEGIVSLSSEGFHVSAVINGELTQFDVSATNIPTLPFSPGKYLEIQRDKDIFRCVLEDGRLVMKMINMLKLFHKRAKSDSPERHKARAV